jgi:hypothetical protein
MQDNGALVTGTTPLEFPFVVPGRNEAPRSAEPQAGPSAAPVRQAATAPATTPKPSPPAPSLASDDRPIFGAYNGSEADATGRWRSRLSWDFWG